MSTKQLNAGIIGAGRIGKVHAETLAFRLPEVRTLAIADVNRVAAQAVAARCGIPTVTESSEEILANPEIEAVLICSSTNTHADLIVQAAQAGKHIFCEKPIAHTLPQIDAALAAVEKAGVKLQIGFNRRFDANFARVRDAVVRGEVGTPRMMHIISRDLVKSVDKTSTSTEGILKLLQKRQAYIQKYYNLFEENQVIGNELPEGLFEKFQKAKTFEAIIISSLFSRGIASGELAMENPKLTTDIFMDALSGIHFNILAKGKMMFPGKDLFKQIIAKEKLCADIFLEGLRAK